MKDNNQKLHIFRSLFSQEEWPGAPRISDMREMSEHDEGYQTLLPDEFRAEFEAARAKEDKLLAQERARNARLKRIALWTTICLSSLAGLTTGVWLLWAWLTWKVCGTVVVVGASALRIMLYKHDSKSIINKIG